MGLYPDGMVEHDGHVGQLLKKLDDLGIADNTIVVYTTDNGAEVFTWPDGGTTPFKGEKATNWEGAFRVPTLIRWPGVIKPGQVINDVCAHEDLIPTFAAAAGEPDLVAKVMKGYQANGKTFKVHLDGYNLMPFLKGEVKESPRKEFIYWSDDGDLMAIRYENWKAAFFEQHAEMSPKTPVGVWQGQFTKLRVPNLYNLRSRPVRARPDEHLLRRLDGSPGVHPGPDAGVRRQVAGELQGVPAAPETRELQPRRGDAEDVGARQRLDANIPSSFEAHLRSRKAALR